MASTSRPARALRLAAAASLAALLVLCLAWELWLAPLRPGGSLLALKAAPLALPLPGILQGRRYTYRWSSMLILAWAAEGALRLVTERDASALLAGMELILSVAFYSAAIAYVRATRA